MRIVKPNGDTCAVHEALAEVAPSCAVAGHLHGSDKIDLSESLLRPVSQEDLREVMSAVLNEQPFSTQAIPAFRLALQEGLVEYMSAEEHLGASDFFGREEKRLLQEMEVLKEERAAADTKNKTQEEGQDREGVQQKVEQLSEEGARLDSESRALKRKLDSPAHRFWSRVHGWLSRIPVIQDLVQEAPNAEEQIESTNDARLEILSSLRGAHSHLMRYELTVQMSSAEARKQRRDFCHCGQELAEVQSKLKELIEFRPSCFGLLRLTQSAKLMLHFLGQHEHEGGNSAEELFAKQRKVEETIQLQLARASRIQERLEMQWAYPEKGAELISWQLVAHPGEVENLVDDFHRRSQILARTLEPSYAQLLLTLQLAPEAGSGSDLLRKLAKLAANLPNFPEAERYLIACAKERIQGEDEEQKQLRLHAFVDLLTGPIGEHLDGFERHLIAAQLGAFEGDPVIIAERYTSTFQSLKELGVKPSFRASLAIVTLMHSERTGLQRLDPFIKVLELEHSLGFEMTEHAVLDAAFISLLPGDVVRYLQVLIAARDELKRHGFESEKAAALALPVSLQAIGEYWKDEIDSDAHRMALEVARLDRACHEERSAESRRSGSDAEELRKLRLQEQLLAQLCRLHELYERSDDVQLVRMWDQVAQADGANLAKQIESDKTKEKTDSNDAIPENDSAVGEEIRTARVDALIAAEEELLRRMREIRHGAEEVI